MDNIEKNQTTSDKEDRILFKTYFFIFLMIFLVKTTIYKAIIFDNFEFKYIFNSELLSVMAMFLFIELSLKKYRVWGYTLFNVCSSIMYISIILYHNYYGSIPTYHSIFQLNQVSEVGESVLALFKPYYLLFLLDLFLLLVFCRKLSILKDDFFFQLKKHNKAIGFSVFALTSIIIPFVQDYEGTVSETKKIEKMGFLNYQIALAYDDIMIERQIGNIDEISNGLIAKTKGISVNMKPKFFGHAKDKNVIVVQLEAFQNFPIGKSVNGQEITPILNKLAKDSFYFPSFYQQVARGNTSDAEFLLNTSIYPSMEYVTFETYSNKVIPSLPRILKKYGYESSTFHTNDKKFYNRGEFYKALGFDKVYDKEYFGENRVLLFGDIDELLYEKGMKELVKSKQKFYAHFVAMTSHHPYQLPSEMKYLKLEKELENTLPGNYLHAVHYADKALGMLIEDLKKNNLWDDTMLVVYGDHFGISTQGLENNDSQLLEKILGEPYNREIMMNVPLLVHVPGESGEIRENVGGQVDIMPTILNLLGVPWGEQIHFGQDLLNTETNLLPQRFYMEKGSFINDSVMFTPGETLPNGKVIKINDSAISDDKVINDYHNSLELLRLSDYYLKSLPERKK